MVTEGKNNLRWNDQPPYWLFPPQLPHVTTLTRLLRCIIKDTFILGICIWNTICGTSLYKIQLDALYVEH